MTQEITFWVLAVIAVLGALVAVRRRNLIHGVFALMIFFAALAGLFLLLLAEFIAAVQILVYIGAVGILLLFVIMLTERVTGDDARDITSRGSFWGWAAVLAVFVFLLLPAIQSADLAQTTEPYNHSVKALGRQMRTPYDDTHYVLA